MAEKVTIDDCLNALDSIKQEQKRLEDRLAAMPSDDSISAKLNDLSKKYDDALADLQRKLDAAPPKPDDKSKAHAQMLVAYYRGREQSQYKDLLTEDPSTGVYMPGEVEQGIRDTAGKESAIYRLADVSGTKRGVYTLRVRTSGTAGGWVAEGGARNASKDPEFAKIDITQQTMYAMPQVSNEAMGDDDGSLIRSVNASIAEALGDVMAEAFVSGKAASNQPVGVLSHTVNIITDRGDLKWGKLNALKTGAAGAFGETNPWQVLSRLPIILQNRYRPNAAWVMNSSTYAEIAGWVDGDKRPLVAQPINEEYDGMLFGKKIYIDDFMPGASDAGVFILLGDFKRGYMIKEHEGMTVLRDPYTTKGAVTFYTEARCGADIVDYRAILGVSATA